MRTALRCSTAENDAFLLFNRRKLVKKHTSAHFSKRSIGSRGRLRLRSWRSVSEMVAIAKTVTWTASCLSYSRRRWVRGRRKNASMPFLACIARPGLTLKLALMGRRRTTLDLRGISELVVRPGARGPRERVMAASRRDVTCRASRRFILGFLAIQRVDGPSLAMLTHPSNSSHFR